VAHFSLYDNKPNTFLVKNTLKFHLPSTFRQIHSSKCIHSASTMNGSWSIPSGSGVGPRVASEKKKVSNTKKQPTNKPKHAKVNGILPEEEKYHAVIVDSGAIIKHTGFSTLHNTARRYVTTQGVIDEIRDSKARSHLESLPFALEVREASSDGLARMVEFSKKTGDYASLSAVDMHILALLYDLEKEGCKSIVHIRTEPKRALIGKVTVINKKDKEEESATNHGDIKSEVVSSQAVLMEPGASFFEGEIEIPETEEDMQQAEEVALASSPSSKQNKSWAALVNHAEASKPILSTVSKDIPVAAMAMAATFGSMNLASTKQETDEGSDLGGQFSDAEDDESLEILIEDDSDSSDDDSSDDEGDEYASIGDDFSDEECDVYILDPEEVEERKKAYVESNSSVPSIENELEMEFPSLYAALTIPYEGSDDEGDKDQVGNAERLKRAEEEHKMKREASLLPVSKSGKWYNSFRGYKDIVKADGVQINSKKKEEIQTQTKSVSFNFASSTNNDQDKQKSFQSRVIGGSGFSGQSAEVDDDGLGWITSGKDIASMKAMGTLDPFGGGSNSSQMNKPNENLPPKSCRAACATTDFAMQNVILQMNLELLTVDGVKVRKLKSWVTRCAACYKIYTGSDNDGRRLFCDRCGSNSLQRIAASVDGKTGRLKLHLKKNFKSKTRGTQFALPKPGTNNKYMGDILLSEDQLLYGAWNQRVKMTKSTKEKQSIFGADIAATVGCHTDLTKRSDIKVGFGRKNPNSTKFGRERRGKKKKTADKACGLKRY
jgi:RNA-binding protein NOB1